jgi:hypothetical protein
MASNRPRKPGATIDGAAAAVARTAAQALPPTTAERAEFDRLYESHLRHLKLKGMRPKTIEAYSRGIRRMGE